MKTAIAVITRNRPRLLANVLDSLAQLEVPEHGSLQYIVVENNDRLSMREVVRKSPLDPAKTRLELEPRIGIPFARNKALKIAARIKCDFLAFIDDDERAHLNWISELVKMQQATDADLVCGAIREQMDLTEANYLQRVVARGITHINERKYQKMQQRISDGTWYAFATCNWMGRMAFIQQASLQFQESLGFGGGEDWLFYQNLQAAGGRATTAPKAIVDAIVTSDRLSIRYQFNCWRERTKDDYHLKNKQSHGIARSVATSFIWFMAGLVHVMLMPFHGSPAFVYAVRRFGKATGRIEAMSGRKSNLYKSVTGD